uniref:Cyclin-dependent kinases regulatory subunit n=1 Tax=Cyprinus carpio TaxID=7962 RepID=A0A8C1R9S5_CYPCA
MDPNRPIREEQDDSFRVGWLNSGTNHLKHRHVVLPRELAKQVPKSHLMSEDEWRRLGVQQSLGWVHYMIHEPGLTHSSAQLFI